MANVTKIFLSLSDFVRELYSSTCSDFHVCVPNEQYHTLAFEHTLYSQVVTITFADLMKHHRAH
jgi:hypothetical protein